MHIWLQIEVTWHCWALLIFQQLLILSISNRLTAKNIGLGGTVLKWIRSFFSDRTSHRAVFWGSVLFILYAADVNAIAERHWFRVHLYADDTQLYFHDKAEACKSWIPCFSKCITDIESWMTSNRLKMNTDKTEIIWLGTRQQLASHQSGSSTASGVERSHMSRYYVWQWTDFLVACQLPSPQMFLSSTSDTISTKSQWRWIPQRPWSTHLLPVAWTTATVSFSRSTLPTSVHFSLSWIRQLSNNN
jgi:hypothetical protein